MSQLRAFRWYVQAFYKKHGAVLIGSVVAGVFLFLVLPGILRVVPTMKRTTYIGRVGRFSLAQIPRDIQDKVSFGLTKSFEDGEIVPALASSYVSEEAGKAYRFTIRPKVVWQDGKVVTPEDVDYSFTDVQTAKSQNDIVYRLITKKQDVNAQEPVLPASFLTTVSQPLFRRVETRNIFFQKKQKVIGLGEYIITSIVDQGSGIKELTLDSDADRLVYRFYPTEHNAIVAFKRGEVDTLEGLLDVEDLHQWNQVTITPVVHTDQYMGVFFNLSYSEGEGALFSSKQLRQALNFALTKPAQNRFLSPINKKSWAYVSDELDLDHYEKDIEQAVSLLMKAETPTPVVIELQTTPSYASQAEDIKKEWEELGNRTADECKESKDSVKEHCENKRIRVQVRLGSFPDTDTYQVMLVGQQIPRDPDQYNLWHSTQATNVTHYKNPRVDKLLEDGRRTQNREERKLMYQEFQRTIVKDSPVIFLQSITTYSVQRSMKLL